MSRNINHPTFVSELGKTENALKIIDDPNHHKMMRKELTMNIFPFGNDGADPRIIIKMVRIEFIILQKFNILNLRYNILCYKITSVCFYYNVSFITTSSLHQVFFFF